MGSFYDLQMVLPMPPTWTEDTNLNLSAPMVGHTYSSDLSKPYGMYHYTTVVGGRYCSEHDLFELDVCYRDLNTGSVRNLPETPIELPVPLGVRKCVSIRRFMTPEFRPLFIQDSSVRDIREPRYEDVRVDRLYFKFSYQLQSLVVYPIATAMEQHREGPLITVEDCFCEDTPFPQNHPNAGAKAAEALRELFPDFMRFQIECPGCGTEESVWAVIQHLNDSKDCHRSREEIADWIEDVAEQNGFNIDFPTPENIPPEPGEDAMKNNTEDK
jgi:hypothetical protein